MAAYPGEGTPSFCVWEGEYARYNFLYYLKLRKCNHIDYLNFMFYNYNVVVEFLKRYFYDYIRTNKSIMCENEYKRFRIGTQNGNVTTKSEC